MKRPRVVIAGAGFGGLTCARALKKTPVEVLLVDRNNYHLFTPLLYQVASAHLDPNEVRVVLIEAAPYVLGAFQPSLREAARRSLEPKGIEVMLNSKVEAVTESSLRLAGSAEIPTGMVIWTAGVRASEIGKAAGVQLARQARIKVDPTLQIPGHPVVFAIGDLAGARHHAMDGEALLPMLIPVAMQAGKHVGACISELVAQGGARAF